MPTKRDYYEVLGLARDATEADIKRAYRRLARQCHPDVCSETDAEERFKELGEAYAVLSDAQRRAQYDRYGHESPGLRDLDFATFDPFSIFDMFFGGRPRGGRARPSRGADRRCDIAIDTEDVFRGAERSITVDRLIACDDCGGSGAAPGSRPQRCPTCAGLGEVQEARTTFFGHFATVTTCPRCRGAGEYIAELCPVCDGAGRTRRRGELTVRVPPGIEDGQQLRYEAEGDAGPRGGLPGDLYVRVFVRPHDVFTRRGSDVIVEQPISFAQAALGARIEVPTLAGPLELTVPPGTQTGESFCLRGKGLPELGGRGEGDQYVVVRVVTPRKLTARQQELLEEFARLGGEELEMRDKSLFDRMRDVFGS